MVNFLIFSAIGPTKYFFGCFPTRLGMGVLVLLQGCIIALDILEHDQIFKDSGNVINKWATMSIQIAIAIACGIGIFWKNKCYSLVVYFTLVGAAAATAAEKIFKIVEIRNWVFDFDIFHLKSMILTWQFIYSARAAFEFIFYFYTAYIAYSYSSENISSTSMDEKLVHSSSK